ncbi:hypothetical protein HNQ80_002549 [Anaerosolibacter carboniphilus]|uniref:DUF5317 domain-containing protein n=1 Tax=Anaerosolibacter carboniphilus TaxID=1417629 RepID=A0A841L233_9FIRM|nr:DUF5317 domain-containing protein [Anaerosolibacter carboniphilus]MBB6216449.1 hypothetical protein [Anaerosolibacter carboniphilus]
MWVESLGSSVILGKFRGGKIKNLAYIYIEKWWLVTLAALIEFTASWIRGREISSMWQYVDQYIWLIHLITYGLLIYVMICNRKLSGFKLILIGIILNFIVILSNGGRMPVNISGIDPIVYQEKIEILQSGRDLVHTVLDETTLFGFLGDVIHLKKPYPLPKTLSIGDLFMMVGVFLFVQRQMLTSINTSKNEKTSLTTNH